MCFNLLSLLPFSDIVVQTVPKVVWGRPIHHYQEPTQTQISMMDTLLIQTVNTTKQKCCYPLLGLARHYIPLKVREQIYCLTKVLKHRKESVIINTDWTIPYDITWFAKMHVIKHNYCNKISSETLFDAALDPWIQKNLLTISGK